MRKQNKFITSHRFRVKRANMEIPQLPEPISIIDREAFVESYLLDDIFRLYQWRLERERKISKNIDPNDRVGKMVTDRNIAMFTAISKIFAASLQTAEGLKRAGYYKSVWKAIHEGQLMRFAQSIKYLPYLREMAVEMLRQLSKDMLDAGMEVKGLEEALDSIEDHEANFRSYHGMTYAEQIEDIIKVAEVAIPDEIASVTSKSKINPNV